MLIINKTYLMSKAQVTSAWGVLGIVLLPYLAWGHVGHPHINVLETASELANLQSITAAGVTIQTLKAETDAQLKARINTGGGYGTGNQTETTISAGNCANRWVAAPIWIYRLGTAYHLTSDASYANALVSLLEDLGDVIGTWPEPTKRTVGYFTDKFDYDPLAVGWMAMGYDRAWPAISAGDRTALEADLKTIAHKLNTIGNNQSQYWHNHCIAQGASYATVGDVINDVKLSHYGRWLQHKYFFHYFTRHGEIRETSHNYWGQLMISGFGLMFTPDLRSNSDDKNVTNGRNAANNHFHFQYYPVTNALAGYSSPGGYTPITDNWIDSRTTYDRAAYTNYDFMAIMNEPAFAGQFTAITNNLYRTYMTPNKEKFVIGNQDWIAAESKNVFNGLQNGSQLWGYTGLAALALGTGTSQFQVWMDWSRSYFHTHTDVLNIMIYGHGSELVGGTGYKRSEDANNSAGQVYNTSTLAQNLVGIHDTSGANDFIQNHIWWAWGEGNVSRYNISAGTFNQENANTFLRNNPSQYNLHNNIILWEPGYSGDTDVQALDVDASDAYKNELGLSGRYSRFLSLVEISPSPQRVYIIDIFRVTSAQGTKKLYWMQHPGHKRNATYSCSETLSLVSPAEILYPEELLSSHDKDTVYTFKQDNFINDATVTNTWNFTLAASNGDAIKTWITGDAGTRIIQGDAPRAQDDGTDPRWDKQFVERSVAQGVPEVFIAVHDPADSTQSHSVDGVSELVNDNVDGGYVAVEVDLSNGDYDYFIHSSRNPPYGSPMSVPTNGTVLTGPIEFAGRFAHVRVNSSGVMQWMKCIDCGQLKYGANDLSSPDNDFGYSGVVTGVLRIADGDATNALQITPIPGMATGATLQDKGVLVQFSTPQGGFYPATQTDETDGFIFGMEVSTVPTNTQVNLKEDPGFVFSTYGGFDGAETIAHPIHHFPNSTDVMNVTFRISGSAYTDGVTTNTTEDGDTSDPPVVITTGTTFTAYNDFSWVTRQKSDKITYYMSTYGNTGSNPLGDSGTLIDHDTGGQVDITMTVTGMFHTLQEGVVTDDIGVNWGEPPAAATDAYAAFPSHIIDVNGAWYHNIDKNQGRITLTNLYNNMFYDVTFYGDRATNTNPDWVTGITLGGSTLGTFTNISSTEADFSGPTDTSTWVSNRNNNAAGAVVRYSHIVAGNSSSIFFTVDGSTNGIGGASDNWGQYLNAMRILGEPVSNPGNPPNSRPVIDVEFGRLFSWTNTKELNASYMDDGLPDPPGAVTTLWEHVTGTPVTNTVVTITNSTLTNATFGTDTAGTHFFTFTAWDGAAVTNRTTSVDVLEDDSGNVAPVITNLNSSYSVTLPKLIVKQTTSVTDDALPPSAAVTCMWTLTNGVSDYFDFVDNEDPNTDFIISWPGTYYIKLDCDDTLLSTSKTVTITADGHGGLFRQQ